MITVATISQAMTITMTMTMAMTVNNRSGGSPHEGKRRELNRERDLVPQKRWQCHRHHDRHHHHDHHQCGLMIIIVGAEEEEASV